MELLRPQDAFFWHVETPSVPEHVAGLAILDPSTAPGGSMTADDLIRLVERRLPRVPQLSRRIVVPWLGLARPAWIEEPSLEARRHVRSVTVRSGGDSEMRQAVTEILSRPLDRRRPMWEMALLEGTDPPGLAWLIKLHHAIADGLGAISAACAFTDVEPAAPDPPAAAVPAPDRTPPPTAPSIFRETMRLHVDGVRGGVLRAASALRSDPAGSARSAWRTLTGVMQLALDGLAPRSALNAPVSPARAFATTSAPMRDVQAVQQAFSCGVNDLVLTAVAAGLHRWFARHGEVAPDMVRAVSPISVRANGSNAAGNWTVGISVPVPVIDLEPRERLLAVQAAARRIRRSRRPDGARFVMQALGTWLPARLHAAAARRMYHGRWFNLIVSAMPGSSLPRSLAGARIVTAYPILPLAPGVGLTVGAMTWVDRLTFGLTGDPDIVPDLDTLAADIGDSLVDLVRAARSSLELDVLRAPASGADANGVLVLDERVEADRPQSSLA